MIQDVDAQLRDNNKINKMYLHQKSAGRVQTILQKLKNNYDYYYRFETTSRRVRRSHVLSLVSSHQHSRHSSVDTMSVIADGPSGRRDENNIIIFLCRDCNYSVPHHVNFFFRTMYSLVLYKYNIIYVIISNTTDCVRLVSFQFTSPAPTAEEER